MWSIFETNLWNLVEIAEEINRNLLKNAKLNWFKIKKKIQKIQTLSVLNSMETLKSRNKRV